MDMPIVNKSKAADPPADAPPADAPAVEAAPVADIPAPVDPPVAEAPAPDPEPAPKPKRKPYVPRPRIAHFVVIHASALGKLKGDTFAQGELTQDQADRLLTLGAIAELDTY